MFAASDASNTIFPPVAFFTHEADKIAALGVTGKAIDTINAVCAQGIEARCVFVRVAHPTKTDPAEKATKEMTNIIDSAASMTGVHALSYACGHVGIEPDRIVTGRGVPANRGERTMTQWPPRRVFLVDDHPVVLSGIHIRHIATTKCVVGSPYSRSDGFALRDHAVTPACFSATSLFSWSDRLVTIEKRRLDWE
ncbi:MULTISPECIES: hypothetical protein [Mesorhizobium]|uniref:hypothetical protein n=1 Tax=Mesorhizobium TaxID=68287 RepID=UPI00145A01DE|nr:MULTISPECIES: hypothetical protein [Mesorhizobium]